KKSALLVMARTWTARVARDVGSRPWEGVSVVDASGRTIADLAQQGSLDSSGDPFATYTCPIDPGIYYLRQQLPAAVSVQGQAVKPVVIEQSLVASPGWALEVYILRRAGSEQQEADSRPRVSVMLRSVTGDSECSDDDYIVIESARTALAD